MAFHRPLAMGRKHIGLLTHSGLHSQVLFLDSGPVYSRRDLSMWQQPWRDSILHMLANFGTKRHVFVRGGSTLTMLKVGRLIWPETLNQLWIANNILRPFIYAPTSLLLRNYDAKHNRLHFMITHHLMSFNVTHICT